MARMKVTFSEQEQAAIDTLRGQLPAATWVRSLVRDAGIAARVLEEASSETEGAIGREQAGPAPVGSAEPVRPAAPPRAPVPAIPGLVRASDLLPADDAELPHGWPPPEPPV